MKKTKREIINDHVNVVFSQVDCFVDVIEAIMDAYLAQELSSPFCPRCGKYEHIQDGTIHPLCVCGSRVKEGTGGVPDLSRTLQVLREFREELDSFVAPANEGGWSLSNLPTHFWETLGGCINDLEEHTKERTNE